MTEYISDHYLSRETTVSVNGLFIIIVFFSHIQSYIALPSVVHAITSGMGQLMVAMFLFYSGFGVGYSVHKKGMAYVHSMPAKRMGKVLAGFVPAVFIYAVLDLVCGIPFTGKQFFFSLVGWENLGNSNWYIFVILCLYLITWLACEISGRCRTGRKREICSFCVLCFMWIFLFFFLHATKESWWYNTMSAYLLGYFVSLTKEKWDAVLSIRGIWLAAIILSLTAVILLRPLSRHASLYLVMTVMFCILVLCLTKKVPVCHPVLYWLGSHLFEIYILMRIPMILLLYIPVPWMREPLVYTGTSLVVTLVLARFYHEFLASRLAR